MRPGRIDPRRLGIVACCVASILPSLLTAQATPPATKTAHLQSGHASSALRPPVESAAPMSFRDVSAQAGLTMAPHSSSERRYIVETMGGGGIALPDCDNDGRLDIAV